MFKRNAPKPTSTLGEVVEAAKLVARKMQAADIAMELVHLEDSLVATAHESDEIERARIACQIDGVRMALTIVTGYLGADLEEILVNKDEDVDTPPDL